MNNWYFVYDASGFSKEGIRCLSERFEKLGFKYRQCTGLGAGPSAEQVIAWVQNNQFISGVSIGVLTNFIYDILKNLYLWFSTQDHHNKNIPIIELFLDFKDLEDKNINAKLKFRIDKQHDKKELRESISSQTKFLYSVSHKQEKVCFLCKKLIVPNIIFFLMKEKLNDPICTSCREKLLNGSK